LKVLLPVPIWEGELEILEQRIALMTWNYRIIKHKEHFALHEVYYDEECHPYSYTNKAIEFICDIDEGYKGIVGSLKMALRDARRHPVLDIEVFDRPVEERPFCPKTEYRNG
jgi:hypothetical protein